MMKNKIRFIITRAFRSRVTGEVFELLYDQIALNRRYRRKKYYMEGQWTCFVVIGPISNELQASYRTVQRSIKRMADTGLLVVCRDTGRERYIAINDQVLNRYIKEEI